MEGLNLKLGKKSFKLKFGLGLFRILGRKWQLPGIDEVVQRIAVLDSADGKLTFEQLDVLEDVLIAAIEYGGCTDDLSKFDIIEEFFADPKALDNFKDGIINSLPKAEPVEEGK